MSVFGQSYDFIPRAARKPVNGRRKLSMHEEVQTHQIAATEEHQDAMGKFAERAVRWFAEQPLEIEWHTLEFRVTIANEEANAQQWQWTVWAS